MNSLAKEKIQKIILDIDSALERGADPIAAFDADGTLWNTDIGESFFQYQIDQKLIPDLPSSPWEYYEKMHDLDSPKAFLWLAQICAGQPMSTVRTWAKESYEAQKPIPFFDGAIEILNHLVKRDVSVYIVTASVEWAVEPAAHDLKIPEDNVIGVVTKVEDGVVTHLPSREVSWRVGKVNRLLEITGGKKPFFAAGNTMGDKPLIDSATHIKFVNCGAKPDSRIFETERELIAIAKNHNWHYLDCLE